MNKTKQVSDPKRLKFTFSFLSTEAEEVFLSGEFNDWNPKACPMKKTADCIWSRTLMIPPGKYEYKFIVDGKWIEDPRNDQVCMNNFGTYNSVLSLPAE